MKPIEKYQEKFIMLLKEAEAELGECLTVKVSSRPDRKGEQNYMTAYSKREEKIYEFSLSTNGSYIV